MYNPCYPTSQTELFFRARRELKVSSLDMFGNCEEISQNISVSTVTRSMKSGLIRIQITGFDKMCPAIYTNEDVAE